MPKRIEIKREERKYQNRGVEIDLPAAYDELEEASIGAVQDALSPYPKA
jgi:hypothetical protein